MFIVQISSCCYDIKAIFEAIHTHKTQRKCVLSIWLKSKEPKPTKHRASKLHPSSNDLHFSSASHSCHTTCCTIQHFSSVPTAYCIILTCWAKGQSITEATLADEFIGSDYLGNITLCNWKKNVELRNYWALKHRHCDLWKAYGSKANGFIVLFYTIVSNYDKTNTLIKSIGAVSDFVRCSCAHVNDSILTCFQWQHYPVMFNILTTILTILV